ncbi:MAG: LmeA family phospholipid-binding protein [Ardenticatenales bacterium]|nr:LmeA family phospholipid-binding protein [Ardenticatenales bacterium]
MTLQKSKFLILALMGLLLLPALACGSSSAKISTLSPDTTEKLDTAAATAAAGAQQLGDIAGTAAAQVATAAPTLQASAQEIVENAATSIPTIMAQLEDAAPTLEAQAAAVSTIIAGMPAGVTMDELKARFADVQLDENGTFSVTITDQEWNAALMARQEARIAANDPPATQDIVFTFYPDRIDLTGNVVSPIQGPLTASFRPYIADGTFQFEILAATINDVEVPKPLLDLAAGSVRETITELISSLPDGLQLTDVRLDAGTMTINGQRP